MIKIKTLILSVVLLVTQSCSHPVFADSIFTINPGTDERNAAHFGMSYAINTTMYALDRRALRMAPVPAFVFAATTTLLIGLTYKMMEPGAGWGEINHAMIWNNAGVIGSGITINLGGW